MSHSDLPSPPFTQNPSTQAPPTPPAFPNFALCFHYRLVNHLFKTKLAENGINEKKGEKEDTKQNQRLKGLKSENTAFNKDEERATKSKLTWTKPLELGTDSKKAKEMMDEIGSMIKNRAV